MIFKEASFKNFRLLSDVHISFSTDENKPLTVIRGENGFGKTTLLDALRWAFYGEASLDPDYKISNSNQMSQHQSIMASVEVLFTAEELARKGDGSSFHKQVDYKIKRVVREELDKRDRAIRGDESFSLYQQVKGSWRPITEGAEVRIRNLLPEALMDVFFIDGDKALAFVDKGDAGERRSRIRAAATEMLDVEVIEGAIERVARSISETTRKAVGVDAESQQYADATKRKAVIEDRLADQKASLSGLTATVDKATQQSEACDTALITEVKKGNKNEVSKGLETVRRGRAQALGEQTTAVQSLAGLLASDQITTVLLSSSLVTTTKALASTKGVDLSLKPLLEKCLKAKKCICGTSLDTGTDHRAVIRTEIKRLEDIDTDASRLFELRHTASRLLQGDTADDWSSAANTAVGRCDATTKQIDKWAAQEAELELQLSRLADSKIDELSKAKTLARGEMLSAVEKATEARLIVRGLERELDEQSAITKELEKTVNRENEYRAHLLAAEDVKSILEASLETVLTDQLKDLSKTMNKEFLRMVGMQNVDEAPVSIREVELNRNFDIKVHSQDGPLNPANALSGAQKRALTFSFIQALMKSSGKIAPSVIDTALGMTSGPLKRELLKRTIFLSTQPIMLLTRSEINDCEAIIEESAGVQLTLTNTGSAAVVNRPKALPTILICNCDIASSCTHCEIREDFGNTED